MKTKHCDFYEASLLSPDLHCTNMHRHVVDISVLIKNETLALIIEKDFLVAIAVIFNADDRS